MKKLYDLGIRADYFLSMAGGKAEPERDMFVGVKAGAIVKVEKFKPRHQSLARKFIDAKGQVCLPGLVNGHTHMPMVLLRGVADDLSFHDWLFKRILPLEGKFVSKEFVRDGLELAALECMRFGVTTVNEMYFFSAEELKTLDRVGLRAIVAQTFASFPLPEDPYVGTDKFSIVKKLRALYDGHERLRVAYGPHAPYTCDDSLLRAVADAAAQDGAPIHIHLSETSKEVKDSLQGHGITPVQRLLGLGILRAGTICAHCVHLDQKDQKIFRESGASAVHNPDSNAKLGSGIAPVSDYTKLGIPVSLGTDGSASNNDLSLFGAMDLATKLQRLARGDEAGFSAAHALWAATLGGARALGLGDLIGSLEVGKRADITLVDLQFPHLQPIHNLVSQLVYAAQGCEVSTTICEGRVLYQNGKYTTLDAEKVFAKAEAWRKKIAEELRPASPKVAKVPKA